MEKLNACVRKDTMGLIVKPVSMDHCKYLDTRILYHLTISNACSVNKVIKIVFLDDCLGYDCHHGNCFINGDGNVECKCKDGWAPPDCDTPQSILNFYIKYYEEMRNRWV